MPVTGLRGRQILDGDVFRNDLNITTSGSAVIRRVIAGTNISISSTGVDTGTGDVTINATGLLPLSGGTLTGTLIFGNASSPNTHTIQFGDNTGWVLRMMTNVSGTPTQRFAFADNGTFSAVGPITSNQANGFTIGGLLNVARIQYGSDAATSYSLLTAANGFAGLYASTGIFSSSISAASGTISGDLILGNISSNGKLTIRGAAGGTSLYLTDATNSTLIISHPSLGVTRFTNGASVLWLSETGGNITLGNSTSAPSRLFVYNDNIAQPTLLTTTQSSLTTLQDTTPFQLTDLYNSGSNGHNLIFRSTASTGSWEYNITKTFQGILTFGVADTSALTRHLYLYSSGQLRFANYTTTTSFTGTAVGVLAFTSDGSIITIATPGGGSGLTGTGTTNYITKFTGSTSVGNSQIFDNGTNVGIGNVAPDAKLRVQGISNGTQAIFGWIDGRGLEIATSLVAGTNDAGSILNARGATAGALIVQTDGAERFRADSIALKSIVPITITTGSADTTGDAFSFTGVASKTFVSISKLGFIRSAASETNGANIHFLDNTPSKRGELAVNSSIFGWYSDGLAGNFMEWNHLTGQIRFNRYTATNSFTGTLVGYLGFTSTGQIITTAAPSGSSQWITNGSDIYYNTGNVGIGATTPLARLHFSTASTSVSNYIRFTNPVGSIYAGQVSNLNWFEIGVPSGAVWMQIRNTGQLRLLQYTAFNSFSTADSVGTLQFDVNGNIQTGILPIYRHSYIAAAPINATPTAGQQFFNNNNGYITRMDLLGYKRARIVARVTQAGITGCTLRVRYRATTFSTTITDYLQMGTSEISIPLNATGVIVSSWIPLVAGAQDDVFIALQTIGGDGNQAITLTQVSVEID